MSCIRKLLPLAFATALCVHGAEEKKDGKEKEPPKVTAIVPFALSTGVANAFKVRGVNLTNATALRFLSSGTLAAEIKTRGNATVPDKADAKKVGDIQLDVELALPGNFPAGDLAFVISTPDGDTVTNQLRVVPRELLFEEKEPNGGFRKANAITVPQTVRGSIETAADVDVFQFHGRAGMKLYIESMSVRYGSLLDPILSVHDAKGHTLVTRDDAEGSADPAFTFSVPTEGTYFMSVMDAHDRGGIGYNYLLIVREE